MCLHIFNNDAFSASKTQRKVALSWVVCVILYVLRTQYDLYALRMNEFDVFMICALNT